LEVRGQLDLRDRADTDVGDLHRGVHDEVADVVERRRDRERPGGAAWQRAPARHPYDHGKHRCDPPEPAWCRAHDGPTNALAASRRNDPSALAPSATRSLADRGAGGGVVGARRRARRSSTGVVRVAATNGSGVADDLTVSSCEQSWSTGTHGVGTCAPGIAFRNGASADAASGPKLLRRFIARSSGLYAPISPDTSWGPESSSWPSASRFASIDCARRVNVSTSLWSRWACFDTRSRPFVERSARPARRFSMPCRSSARTWVAWENVARMSPSCDSRVASVEVKR